MTKLIPIVALLYSTFTFAALIGCSDESKNKPAAQDEADDHDHEHEDHDHEHHEGDGHDHDHDDHDHKGGDHKHEDKHSHNHPSEGPHGGHLIELGRDDYHAELVHRDADGVVSIYLLDGRAADAVTIWATELVVNLLIDGTPKQFRLGAAPMEDEAIGRCSRFQSADERLGDLLGETAEISGRLNVTIDGRQFVGIIEHQPNDGHEHEPIREAKVDEAISR